MITKNEIIQLCGREVGHFTISASVFVLSSNMVTGWKRFDFFLLLCWQLIRTKTKRNSTFTIFFLRMMHLQVKKFWISSLLNYNHRDWKSYKTGDFFINQHHNICFLLKKKKKETLSACFLLGHFRSLLTPSPAALLSLSVLRSALPSKWWHSHNMQLTTWIMM